MKKTDLRINQQGATIVEFAIAGITLLALAGVIFDFGIGFYKYSALTHTCSEVSSEFSKSLALRRARGDSVACSDILNDVHHRAEGIVQNTFKGIDVPVRIADGKTLGDYSPAKVGLTAYALPPTAGEPPTFRIEAQMQLDCFFCEWFPKGVTLSAASESMIESEDFVTIPSSGCKTI